MLGCLHSVDVDAEQCNRAYLVRLINGTAYAVPFNLKGEEMLEAYSLNVAVGTDSAVPFNSISIEKGCTARLASPTSIELNKCGVYMVAVNASTPTSTTIQLSKDGVLQPQAQSTGITPSFVTLVQVATNNTCCAGSSPVVLQVINSVAGTFTDANIVVTKIV